MNWRVIPPTVLLVVLALIGCDEFRDPPPASPTLPPPPPASQFDLAGHWEATTAQGRRIAFDVTSDLKVIDGRINLHHDCNTGRWRATFDGFESNIVGDSFNAVVNWRTNDAGLIRSGSYSITGRFESANRVRGSFASAVTDSRMLEQPTGEVCPSIQITFEGDKQF